MKDERMGKKLLDISSMAVKTVMYAMLLAAIFIYLYYGSKEQPNQVQAEDIRYIEHWRVEMPDGTEKLVDRTYRAETDFPEDYAIYSTLPEDVEDNEYLCFQVGKNVAVYVDGELRKDYIEKRDVIIPGGSVKRYYILVPLYSSDAGKEVKMIRESTVKKGLIVPEAFVSTFGGCYDYMLVHYGLTFILSVVIFVFSIVVIAVSVAMSHWYKRKINMLYGAMGIMIISAWLITDSFLFPFVFGKYHLDGVMNYMLCLLIPLGPVLYLNAIQHGRYLKSMTVIMSIASINAIVWPILHFTRVISFDRALTYITIILGILSFSAIVILGVEIKRGNYKEYKYTVIGFMGLLICGIIEIIVLLFMIIRNESIPMIIGLGFFLTFVVLQQVEDLRKIFLEKQKAINLSEAKSQFLASMSHEIRTPINAVIGMNEMILRESKEPNIRDYAYDIQSASKTLLTVINGVLDFSRIESGKMEIVPAQYDVAELIDDLINMISDSIGKKKLELKLDIDEKLPKKLYGDDMKLRQVIVNLLTNAVKYTDKGSITLTMHVEEMNGQDCMLFVEVKDTGIGIRQEDMEKIFLSFQRLDEKRNRTIEGTGLGMSIVGGMLKLMDSKLEIQSKYGEGSAFSFRVKQGIEDSTPLGVYRKDRKEEKEQVQKKSLKVRKADILVVDDNELNLRVAKALMKKLNVFPDLADSGQKAIEMIRQKHYDIVFMDHMMPEMDGMEALEILIKEKLIGADTAVIALTANAISGAKEVYLEAGFRDYLSKPMNTAELEQMIAEYLPDDNYTYE